MFVRLSEFVDPYAHTVLGCPNISPENTFYQRQRYLTREIGTEANKELYQRFDTRLKYEILIRIKRCGYCRTQRQIVLISNDPGEENESPHPISK